MQAQPVTTQPMYMQPVPYNQVQTLPQEQNYGWKLAERVGEQAYEGSASLGKIVGMVGASFAMLIGILLLGGGLYFLFRKNTSINTEGTIKKAECTEVTTTVDNKKVVTQNCILDITYTVDGTSYSVKRSTDGAKVYKDGQTISISYDPSNPADAYIHTVSEKTIGWILLIISIFVIGGAGLSMYLTMKYKMYQAAQGVGVVSDVVF